MSACGACKRELEVGDGSDCWVCGASLCGGCLDAHVKNCEREFEAKQRYHRRVAAYRGREAAQEQRLAELKDEGGLRRR